jgi:hypothetical protein
MHGPGTLISETIFTGQMSNNKKDQGIIKLPNGDEYHGKFDNGIYSGYSTFRFKNGDWYNGDF